MPYIPEPGNRDTFYHWKTGNPEVHAFNGGTPPVGYQTEPPTATHPDYKVWTSATMPLNFDDADGTWSLTNASIKIGDICVGTNTASEAIATASANGEFIDGDIIYLKSLADWGRGDTARFTRPSEKPAPAGRFYCGKTKKIAPQDTHDRYIDEINGNIQVMGGNLFQDNGWNHLGIEGFYRAETTKEVPVLKTGNYMYVVIGGQGAGAPFNEQMQFNGNKNPFNTKSILACGGGGGCGGIVVGKVYATKGDTFSVTVGKGGVAATAVGGISTGGNPSCFSHNGNSYYAGGGGAGGLGGRASSPIYPENENTDTGFKWAGAGAPGQGGRPGNYIGGSTPAHNNSTTGGYGGGNTGASSRGSLAGRPFGYPYQYSWNEVIPSWSVSSDVSPFIRGLVSNGNMDASIWNLYTRGGRRGLGASFSLDILCHGPSFFSGNPFTNSPQFFASTQWHNYVQYGYSQYRGEGAHCDWYIYATYLTCDNEGVQNATPGGDGDVFIFYLDGIVIPGAHPSDPHGSGIKEV